MEPGNTLTREYAEELDRQDPLKHLRAEFIIPSKADLKAKTLPKSLQSGNDDDEPCIYLCGNSLGLQSRRTSERVNEHLRAWAVKGVYGHYVGHEGTTLPPFLDADELTAKMMAPLVGASPGEVAIMETLTANLHLMMASFYRPTRDKYKIVLEGKAFPSDQYAIQSQIIHHGFDPKEAMVVIEPVEPASIITTSQILSIIDEHASSTALIVLPGIQYYTGQYLDIKTITAHAHSRDLLIGWDLAHAVGNVELFLHDWEVDFAVWCSYKYVNSGPGAIGGLFVHEKYGKVDMEAAVNGGESFRPRLSGWWGGDKKIRFDMGGAFRPIPGAAGYQVGNSSALAAAALQASLEIFAETSMKEIRKKSMQITDFLENLLLQPPTSGGKNPYWIITPSNPAQRGAQLSVQLEPGLLDGVLHELEEAGAVVDERKPDVIRVAPVPLYNSYKDVWDFVELFRTICIKVKEGA